MKTPDWDDLRFLLALHDAGSLSGAARATGVEHTTVARRIDALEAALQIRLFDRFPRGWSLTAAGHALIPDARRMEEGMHALMRSAGGANALTGSVRISAPPALATWMLAPRIKQLLRRLPGIDIDLRGEVRETDLMRREADIALRFKRPDAPGLAVRAIASVDYALYASAIYLEQREPAHWEFLGYDETLADAPQQRWLDKIRGERRYCLRANDLGTLYQAALAGCGVAVLPGYFFREEASELVQAGEDTCPVKRKLWLVMHQDVRRSARVRAVADELGAMFNAFDHAVD